MAARNSSGEAVWGLMFIFSLVAFLLLSLPDALGLINTLAELGGRPAVPTAVMEKAENVLMIPADFGWNDLGTWASMAQIWPKDDQHNVYQGEIMALDSRHNVVFSRQKLCVLLGVDDLIVVDTEDALLVCPVHKAQDIGKILDVIRQKGMEEYL